MTRVAALRMKLAPLLVPRTETCIVGVHLALSGGLLLCSSSLGGSSVLHTTPARWPTGIVGVLGSTSSFLPTRVPVPRPHPNTLALRSSLTRGRARCLAVEYVVAVLAALSEGAPFLPLDPAWPAGKLQAMVAHASPTVVVVGSASVPPLRLPPGCATVELLASPSELLVSSSAEGGGGGAREGGGEGGGGGFSAAGAGRGASDDSSSTPRRSPRVAYVMFTSGSCGTPKGVCGTEQGILNRVRWMADAFPYRQGEVCCCKTSTCFVDSIAEVCTRCADYPRELSATR
jgi:acyl-CoA synthetase (AMP-forming)/AMP-acid ligase II